jgi:hypothetical protein
MADGRWEEKRRRVQVDFYTGKIADGRWSASILRRALVAWKVSGMFNGSCMLGMCMIWRMWARGWPEELLV